MYLRRQIARKMHLIPEQKPTTTTTIITTATTKKRKSDRNIATPANSRGKKLAALVSGKC